MAVIQVPPAVGTSGQFIDSIVITSSTNRQIVIIGDPTSTSGHAPASTGGLSVISTSIVIASGTVTATAATNPWSSAPGFNVPIVSASSGLIQISGNITSTATTITSGTVTLSSAIAISSGTITATAATNPWSSAPGFNMPVVSVSSGHIGTFDSTTRQYTVFAFNSSSSNSVTNVTTAPAIFYGWNVGNQTTGSPASVKVYNLSSAPTVGSTTGLLVTIPVPGSTAGSGNNWLIKQGISSTAGIAFTITANFGATDTGTRGAGDIVGNLYYTV